MTPNLLQHSLLSLSLSMFYFKIESLSLSDLQALLSLVYLTSSNILMLIEFTGFATWVSSLCGHHHHM